MREETLALLKETRLVAIVRGFPGRLLEDLARALEIGGVRMIEVTFVQNAPETWTDTAEGIRLVNRAFSGRVLAGAGTVLSLEQLHLAADAGAGYIISPNTDEGVIRETRRLGLVSLPGAMTPTEIVSAWIMGADLVKVFPADKLGPAWFKAVRAPLSHIPLLAVGGVNERNAAEFIRSGAAGIGAGGNLANREWMENGEAGRITALAADYVQAVQKQE